MKKNRKHIRKGQRVQLPVVEGIFTAAAGGFGFVEAAGQPSVFIPAQKVGHAITGDRVSAAITDPHGTNNLGPVGEIRSILSRGRKYVVGELLPGRELRPMDEHFNGKVRISGSIRNAHIGDWVKVRLLDSGKKFTENLKGTIEENYGENGSIAADLKAVAAEFDLPEPYSEADNRAAAKLKLREIKREDLRNMFTVTIDPEDAKDFDDAISIADGPEPGTILLGVHIADVAARITAGTKFDKKASERGFSAYLPGMFLPMLPGALTALISLRQGVDSPAHSVLFTVRKSTGKILASRRVHSFVNINARLNYDEVQKFIDSPRSAPGNWTAELKKFLKELISLTRKIRRLRMRTEMPLSIETSEIRVICNSADMTITGLKKNVSREAEQLVEECMLAANSAVASELIERHAAGMFRVHAEPMPAKLDDFSRLMQTSFRISTGDLSERANCEHFLKNLPDDPRKPVIISNFLRSLPRAVYDSEPALHYGLGKYRYSHFTSPIRRYPDLLVHRQLWALDTNGKLMSKDFLHEAALRCSALEERSDNACFAANDRLKLHYLHLQNDPDAEMPTIYEAVIARIMPTGLLCDIEDLGLYGFVPSEKLSRGGTHYNRNARKLKVQRGHSQYKCGDVLYVVLDSLDFVRGRAVFRPV